MTANLAQPSLYGGAVPGRSLAIAWLMLGVATLGASTLFAILVAGSRSPATSSLLAGHDFFHLALIVHVALGPVLSFLAFAMALWHLALPKQWDNLGWLGYALAALGAAVLVLVPAGAALGSGAGEAILSNYIPVLRSTMYLTGLVLFGSGFALSLVRVLRWLRPGLLPSAEHPPALGLFAGALAAAVALGSLLWSALALPQEMAAASYYEMLFWGPGHILQSMHVLLMMAAWLVIANRAGIPLRSSAKQQTLLFLLASLPVLAAPLVHLAYAPHSDEFRNAYTGLMRWAIWPGVVLLAADILYGLTKIVQKGERWSAATWSLALSILLLAAGLAIGFSINANNAVVPAHYHATTGAITMAYLGLALVLLPRLGYTSVVARWPVLAYGTGTLLMAAALGWAGYAGMTRKLPGSDELLEGYSPHLAVVALGGTLVIIGGIGFVAIMLRGWLRASELPKRNMVALLSIAGLIMLLGLACTLVPGSGASPPAKEVIDPHTDPDRHIREAQQAEIAMRFQQAVTMLHAKRYDLAIPPLQRVLKLDPNMPEAHVNMGFALLGLKRLNAAHDAFQTALDLRSTQANAYYGMALTLKEMKDTGGAVGAMRSYIHLADPGDPYLNQARAELAAWERSLGRRPGGDLPSIKGKQQQD